MRVAVGGVFPVSGPVLLAHFDVPGRQLGNDGLAAGQRLAPFQVEGGYGLELADGVRQARERGAAGQ